MLNVNDVAEYKIGISKSVSIDYVHYGLVPVGFMKDDHYFCQILSSQSNHEQGDACMMTLEMVDVLHT